MSINLTYTQAGDYYIPDLALSEQNTRPIGKYGRMRKRYLEEHRPILWNRMVLTESLFPHLREIDETANRRLEQIMLTLAKAAGVTEELKAHDPMKWVGLINPCKAQAEEIIFQDLSGILESEKFSTFPIRRRRCFILPRLSAAKWKRTASTKHTTERTAQQKFFSVPFFQEKERPCGERTKTVCTYRKSTN